MVDKSFVGPDLYGMGLVGDGQQVLNLVYRNGMENQVYVKRFHTPKFILNREYRLFDDDKRSTILFLKIGTEGIQLRASLMPAPRAKSNVLALNMDDFLVKGAHAKGKRLTTRKVRRITEGSGPSPKEAELQALPGLLGQAAE